MQLKTLLILALVTVPLGLAPATTADPTHAQPVTGPDVPAASAPVAVVTAFENEEYTWTEGVRERTITVPHWDWNRVVVELRVLPHPSYPDPWDRLVGVAVNGAEILRGTTPRTDMTLTKDVTEFARLLPPGEDVPVSLTMGSYEGGTLTTVRFKFYDDATAALVRAPADDVVPAFRWGRVCGGGTLASTVTFPDAAPTAGTLEVTLSGHGDEEAYFLAGRSRWNEVPELRAFHVLVDGEHVATTHAWPFMYAILGFYGDTGQTLHPVMWWSAQRALDHAGVHSGVGEVPPNRITLPDDVLPLLTGERTVEIRDAAGRCVWITSATFLLDR